MYVLYVVTLISLRAFAIINVCYECKCVGIHIDVYLRYLLCNDFVVLNFVCNQYVFMNDFIKLPILLLCVRTHWMNMYR